MQWSASPPIMYLTHWDDGTPIGDDEKAMILDRVVDAAAARW